MENNIEYLARSLNIETSYSATCDFTNSDIERMEPHLCLFEEMKMSREGCSILDDSDVTELSRFGRVLIDEIGEECEACHRKEGSILKMGILDGPVIDLCEDCLESFIEVCKVVYVEVVEDMFLHYDESGFDVRRYPEKGEFLDLVEDEEIQSRYMVSIGCDENAVYNSTLCLKNIKEFHEGLVEPQNKDFIYDEAEVSCNICGGENKNGITFGMTSVCRSCHKNLTRNIGDFIENNGELIVSLTI